ncbi:SCO0268 family class II lanthipeptide [Streptomyces sp. NPDC049887]|uniref:SCO0268 family class II lanthipeptide n=1 Tax=unclassified Streptomyces TaxID=2593676 RepID=UPI00341E7125
MRNEFILQADSGADFDLDLDLRVSDVPEHTQEFGQGTFTSPSSYAIGTRCPVCC